MALAKCWYMALAFTHVHQLNPIRRFVLTSTQEVKDKQAKESVDVDKEIENLNKKLHYLETTYNNAQLHLEQIFKRGS